MLRGLAGDASRCTVSALGQSQASRIARPTLAFAVYGAQGEKRVLHGRLFNGQEPSILNDRFGHARLPCDGNRCQSRT